MDLRTVGLVLFLMSLGFIGGIYVGMEHQQVKDQCVTECMADDEDLPPADESECERICEPALVKI